MGAPTTQKQMSDELHQRLKALQQELETMNQAVEQVLSGRRKQKPARMFPLSVLEQLIGYGLETLERAVGRLVKAIIH